MASKKTTITVASKAPKAPKATRTKKVNQESPTTTTNEEENMQNQDTTPANEKKTRIRRDPVTLLSVLLKEREEIEAAHAARMEKINSRIDRIQNKNQDRIALQSILASKTPEEIEADLQAARETQKLLRLARKAAANSPAVTQVIEAASEPAEVPQAS